MKRTLRTSLLATLMLLGAACSRHTVIPDEELAMIFRDAYLANAYISDQRVSTDSLRIYEPIFARYGYTTEDVHYTIGNFSKRKSARLSDVVERAIDLLEAEGKIIEALPNATFKVQLSNGYVITAYISGKLRMNYIRIIPGDTVKLEMSPYDLTKGRITWRSKS